MGRGGGGGGGRYSYVFKANSDNTLVRLQPKRPVNPQW